MPRDVDDMTLSEIAAICAEYEDDEVTPEHELRAYAAWWQSLSPEERLWAEAD